MADETTTLRRCSGSTRFGIVAHEAPVEEFPRQPSQKDGLGRMCHAHWRQYTNGLRKDALARKAAEGGAATEVAPTESEPDAKPEPLGTRTRLRRQQALPEAGSQGDAG